MKADPPWIDDAARDRGLGAWRLSLRLMLPLAVLAVLLLASAASLWSAVAQGREALLQQSRADLGEQATRLARLMAAGPRAGARLLESEIAHATTDPRVAAIAVLDAEGRVLQAGRLAWRGRPAREVLPGLEAERLARVLQGGRPDLAVSPDGTRLSILAPWDEPPVPGRVPRRGAIWIGHDLGPERAALGWTALSQRAPELAGTLLLALLLGVGARRGVMRPLAALEAAAHRLGEEGSGPAPVAGPREVARLGSAFNAMSARLSEVVGALQASQTQLGSILHSMSDALVATDPQGRVALLNPAAERLTGWTQEEAFGRPVEEVLALSHSESGEALALPVAALLAGEDDTGEAGTEADAGAGLGSGGEAGARQPPGPVVSLLRARDGSSHPVALRAAPIRPPEGAQGGTAGVVLVLRDVAEAWRLRRALHESELHFRTLADAGSALIWTTRADGSTDYVNRGWRRYAGRTAEGDPMPWSECLHPDDRAEAEERVGAALARQAAFTLSYRLRSAAGGYRWFLHDGAPRHDAAGAYLGHVHHCLDISEQVAASEAQRLAAVAFETSEAIVITDGEQRILRVNRAFTRLTGYAPGEAIGRTPRLLHSDRHDEAFHTARWRELLEKDRWEGEIWCRRKDGSVYPQWEALTVVRDAQDRISHFVATFFDLTERKAAEELIHRLAYYDPLTGLPNRQLLLDRIGPALAAARRGAGTGALLFVDLDRFKHLNDARGHDAGDELLVLVARRLADLAGPQATVARFGGDEFVVLLPALAATREAAEPQARRLAGLLLAALGQPLHLRGGDCTLGASIGVTLFPAPDAEDTVDDLLKQADTAMYRAKADGRNQVCFFERRMQAVAEARFALEAELRGAARRGELQMHLQVQVGPRGQWVGAEALVRWRHPRRGMVSPGEFVPLAEETGLIVPIGQWMLEQACKAIAQLQAGGRPLRLSVNVSASQFREPGFVAEVAALIARHGVEPRWLTLEVTESLVIEDVNETAARMAQLKALGIRLSLDDFGTGYSSLAHLKQLPLDELKIDRSFVRDVPRDANDAALVEAILSVAGHMRLEVVAEGVETAEQAAFLVSRGCEVCQGFHFGRPQPAAQFLALRLARALPVPREAALGLLDEA